MPSRIPDPRTPHQSPSLHITKFTNARILLGDKLHHTDLWIDTTSGKLVDPQDSFFSRGVLPEKIVDVKGRILAPGFLDVQLNGAFGFDISEVPADGNLVKYRDGLRQMNSDLVSTGVTSYLATMPSQESKVYHQLLPHLGPSGLTRIPADGAESLGAHCEGPFIAPERKGCHSPEVIGTTNGDCTIENLSSYYGSSNLKPSKSCSSSMPVMPAVKMITLAPELPGAIETIRLLRTQGVLASVGHTKASYSQTVEAVEAGANMITHLFNAMNSLHHRDPGPFGAIVSARDSARPSIQMSAEDKPYFGIIADGIHLHPTTVSLSYSTHSSGFILVTDAVKFMGCQDGVYAWNNGQFVEKTGSKITLQGTETIAGGAASLLDCVNNFLTWTGAPIAAALNAVTRTPAKMLGIDSQKGVLTTGADADLVILAEAFDETGATKLSVDEVWKFGKRIYYRNGVDI